MSIVLNDPIVKQDIIDRFNTRVRDWVTTNTNWISTTAVWNTTVGFVTANSATSGGHVVGGNYPGNIANGPYNRTAFSTAEPASIVQADLSAEIGAQPLTVGHVVKVLKDFMVLYANNHKIELMNSGNLTPAGARTSFGSIPYVGTVRLDNVVSTVKTDVENDINAAVNNRNVKNGELVQATNLINFIEDCRNIWTARCLTNPVEQFRYTYCHSSCHSNHGSHGSRGRR
jgi:hypothetical protein